MTTTELPWPVHPAAERLPLLTDDELRVLADDIAEHGLREEVTLYDDPVRGTVLLDGRNRTRACLLADVEIDTRWYRGTRPYAYVISENIRRRHLSAGQAIAVVMGVKDELHAEREADHLRAQAEVDARRRKAEAAAETQRLAGERSRAAASDNEVDHQECALMHTPGDPLPEPEPPHRAADDIADVAGVSGRSVAQFLRVQEQAPDLIAKVESGEMSLAEAEKELRQRVKDAARRELDQKREAATAKAAAAMAAEVTTDGVGPIEQSKWRTLGPHLLYCGDSSDPEFIDRAQGARLAFADPPYNAGKADWDRGFVWDHDYLTEAAQVVLVTPGISAIADFFKVTTMFYRWSIAAHITNGMTRGALGFGNWIYVAVFSNADSIHRNAQDHLALAVDSSSTHESAHESRKPARLLVDLLHLFTSEGDTVVDPFLGSGTTLFAAEQTGRRCIGAEINPQFQAEIIARYGEGATRL